MTKLNQQQTATNQRMEEAITALTQKVAICVKQNRWSRGEERRRFSHNGNNLRRSSFNVSDYETPRRRKGESVSGGNLSEFNNKMSKILSNLRKINTTVVKVVNPSPPNSKGDTHTVTTTVAEATKKPLAQTPAEGGEPLEEEEQPPEEEEEPTYPDRELSSDELGLTTDVETEERGVD